MFKSPSAAKAAESWKSSAVPTAPKCPTCGGKVLYQGFTDLECGTFGCVNASKKVEQTEGDWKWAWGIWGSDQDLDYPRTFECMWTPELVIQILGVPGYVTPNVWRWGNPFDWAKPSSVGRRPERWRLKPI